MEKHYEQVKEDYIRISSDTRNKLTALSVTVIAAIYFFSTPRNAFTLRLSLLFYFLTILTEIAAGFLKSQHYSLWFEHKINTVDYRESEWGKWADRLFWLPAITFVIGSLFFFVGIFASPEQVTRTLPEKQTPSTHQ